jgi:hypothetical protein
MHPSSSPSSEPVATFDKGVMVERPNQQDQQAAA